VCACARAYLLERVRPNIAMSASPGEYRAQLLELAHVLEYIVCAAGAHLLQL